MTPSRIATLFAVLFLAQSLCAEELSLQTAIDLALENDLRLLPTRTALQRAQIQQEHIAVWEDPELRLRTGFDDQDLDTAFRIYLPQPWSLDAEKNLRSAQTAEAVANQQRARLTSVTQTTRLYREFQCLEKELILLARQIDIEQQRVDLSQKQLSANRTTSSQVLLQQWNLREIKQKKRVRQRDFILLKTSLATRTGLFGETLQLPPLEIKESPFQISIEEAIQIARAQRPELQLLRAQRKQTAAQMDQIHAQRIPWFNHLQSNYSDRNQEWGVQVAISLPIFSQSRSRRAPLLAEQSLQQTALEISETAIQFQVREQLALLESAQAEWQILQTEHADLIHATHSEISKLKEFASAAPEEWLRLEEHLLHADHAQLNALRNIYIAQADLFFVIGKIQ